MPIVSNHIQNWCVEITEEEEEEKQEQYKVHKNELLFTRLSQLQKYTQIKEHWKWSMLYTELKKKERKQARVIRNMRAYSFVWLFFIVPLLEYTRLYLIAVAGVCRRIHIDDEPENMCRCVHVYFCVGLWIFYANLKWAF